MCFTDDIKYNKNVTKRKQNQKILFVNYIASKCIRLFLGAKHVICVYATNASKHLLNKNMYNCALYTFNIKHIKKN